VSRPDIAEKIHHLHLKIFDYVQDVSKAILETNDIRDDYDQDVIDALANTIKENPSSNIDPALSGDDSESLKKR